MNKEIVIEALNISKTYKNAFGRNPTVAFKDRCFSVYRGESLGMIGVSGSGKSTMARILLNLIPFDSGKVLFKGEDISSFDKRKMLDFRRQVQFIVQRPESFFDPRIKFYKSIREGVFLLRKNNDYDRELSGLMKRLDLDEMLLHRYPHQISGGEIQRFAILRALLVHPEIIVFDEATSMLDVSTQAKIVILLQELKSERGLTYVFISHDYALIKKICSRIVEFDLM